MLRGTLFALIVTCAPALVMGEEMASSLHPQGRPAAQAAEAAKAPIADGARPKVRPAPDARSTLTPTAALVSSSLRPQPRPRAVMRPGPDAVTFVAAVAPPSTALTRSRKGSVCGDPAIKGETLAPVTARIRGCGIDAPVRVTSISGVGLSEAATIDCPTAKALRKWVDTGLQPAFSNKVTSLRIAGSYTCRPRNNQKGAKISEHGRGKAVDIAAIVLADGRTLTVEDNWNKTLRRVYKAACGIFGTTLGPGSDGYHEDHMHFDTATRRGGAYCR